jgi:hypothetical protein
MGALVHPICQSHRVFIQGLGAGASYHVPSLLIGGTLHDVVAWLHTNVAH